MLEYLSPTQLMKFEASPETYYMEYISGVRAPREPQNPPMALGSAFDAYIKSALHGDLGGFDPNLEREKLYETQVEPHMRDVVRKDCETLFEMYTGIGAYDDLLVDLTCAMGKVDFETDLRGDVGGVPLRGKPDVFFWVSDGVPVVMDFKVNGYYSASPPSPAKGYLRQRSVDTRYHLKPHKTVDLGEVSGVRYNKAFRMEEVDSKWALQMVTYAWLMGVPVGIDVLTGVEQIIGTGRVAQHRLMVSGEYSTGVWNRYRALWDLVTGDGWSEYFGEEKCNELELRAFGMSKMIGW